MASKTPPPSPSLLSDDWQKSYDADSEGEKEDISFDMVEECGCMMSDLRMFGGERQCLRKCCHHRMSDSECKAVTFDALVKAYSEDISRKIAELASNHCYGCKVNHPSQIQHNMCVMLTWEEKVELFFHEALHSVNNGSVLNMWLQDLHRNYTHVFRELNLIVYLDDSSRNNMLTIPKNRLLLVEEVKRNPKIHFEL